MKRFLAMLLVLTMALSLAACGGNNASTPDTQSSDSQSSDDGKVHLSDGSVYPEGPIELICPYAAGGSSDTMCRKIAEMSQEYFGVNMNVVNIEGGNAAVGLGQLASTTNNGGYSMSLYAGSNFSVMPYVQDTAYAQEDFSFLHGVSDEPLGVMVRADSEWNCLQDVVDTFKENGKTIMHGQSGTNGGPHMWSLLMFQNMGVEQSIVAYSGASTALAALLGNEVDMVITQPTNAQGMIDGGEVKVIAVFTEERVDQWPDAATVKEQGFGDLFCSSYKGIVLPADTDPAIVEWLDERLTALVSSQEWADFLGQYGIIVNTSSGAEMEERFANETDNLWPVMESLGVLKAGAVKP